MPYLILSIIVLILGSLWNLIKYIFNGFIKVLVALLNTKALLVFPTKLVEIKADNQVIVFGLGTPGVTTYLAALTLLSSRKIGNILLRIEPLNHNSKGLSESAKNVMMQSSLLLGSCSIERYFFGFTIDQKYILGKRTITHGCFSCKDFPRGTPFQNDLSYLDGGLRTEENINLNEADILILILFNGQMNEKDLLAELKPIINELRKREKLGTSRIAIGLNRCDDVKLYTQLRRFGAEKLFEKLFPKAYQINKALKTVFEIEYFAMSNFGMISTKPPVPNVNQTLLDNGYTSGTLKNSQVWKPFGLISPLYWLSTGKRHPQLDKDYL
ncbi:hypothetical protein B9G53_25405 [Pseudanabaena sp. SR411]|nr:hypothetical protein B9G53_25405 [Pseudanabaena sp. SR411]